MSISWMFFVLLGLLCSLFLPNNYQQNDPLLFFIIILLMSLFVIFYLSYSKLTKKDKIIILAGYTIRVLFLLFDLYCRDIFTLPNSGLDTESYANWAKSGFLSGDYMRGGTYAKFIAFWYHLFGIQRPIVQYINVLLYVSIALCLIRILNLMRVKKSIIHKSILLISFLPNTIIMNSILLRETIIVFFITYSFYYFTLYIIKSKKLYLIISCLLGLLATSFHSGAIGVIVGYGVVLILYNKEKKSLQLNKSSIIKLFIFIIVFMLIYINFSSLFSKFNGVSNAQDIIDTASKYSDGGSAYDVGFAISNPYLNLIINTPLRMFYFLTSPLPWLWRGISDVIAFLFSSSIYLYCIYYAFIKFRGKNMSIMTKILIIVCLSCVFIFAWGVSNSGTAVRHREKFISLFIILYALIKKEKMTINQNGNFIEEKLL